MSSNFTDSVTNALQQAFAQAQQHQRTEVTDNQLLLAFLEEPEGYFNSILTSLKTNPSTLIQKIQQEVGRQPTFSGGGQAQPPNTARNLQSRIADAQSIAQKWNDSYVSSDHFLLSYWKNPGEPFAQWKQATGITLKSTRRNDQKNSRRPTYGLT